MERDWPTLHRQVVFGRSNGKIIWQPRIGCWFTDKQFAGEPFPPPYTGMDLWEIYRELDCSARLYQYNACFRRIEHPAVETVEHELNETDTEIVVHTPVGKQVAVRRRMLSNWHYLTVKWPVETEEELSLFLPLKYDSVALDEAAPRRFYCRVTWREGSGTGA
ncbi:MAG: hypothetical protein AB8I80_21515, partial [Anaerolineae bacterium]